MAVEVLPQSAALGAETARPVAGGADTAQAGTDRPAADPTDNDPADTGRADTTGPEGDAGTDERQPGTEQSASSRPAPPASPAPTTSVLIPLAAIVAAADGTPTVWVVDPQTSEVSQRAIETGAVQGGEVAVLSGLTPGEQIVTAGVHHLRAGMRVHPLAPGL
jgi:multidrug efflux pump subunit AcrA (membrane-fusion protein)